MARHHAGSFGLGLVALVGACFSVDPTPLDPTFAVPVGTDTGTSTEAEPTTTATDGATSAVTTAADSESSADGTDTSPPGDSTGPAAPVCGNAIVEDGEECDDGNADDTDDCPSTCTLAICGDGFVLAGVEACDDGNPNNDDACLDTCVAASCGDGFVHSGVEGCDDQNMIDTDACPSTCVPASCGDGFVHTGVEECDDDNVVGGDGCGPTCLAECANPGGGGLTAENGTNMGVLYCYNAGDSTQVRASKACESHFGIGNCCVITGGYSDQQYGQCGLGGGGGSLHWHWDFHPAGHCDPNYVPGDVVSPGWCGVILGSFID